MFCNEMHFAALDLEMIGFTTFQCFFLLIEI